MSERKNAARNSTQAKQPNKDSEKATVEEKELGRRQGCLNTCLAVVATIFCACVALVVYTQFFYLHEVRDELSSLSDLADIVEFPIPRSEFYEPYISAFDKEMRGINAEYICWIGIGGTEISYPVVRSDDNEKYLNLSFLGEYNYFGSLFMDYRCTGDYVPHIIIYGHNSRHGDLFGSLRKFLDEQYITEHPIITLVANDRIVEYEIFSARLTNVGDPAYFLDFSSAGAFRTFAERCGAPNDATQIITLSTCYSGGNDNERIIIQGSLR